MTESKQHNTTQHNTTQQSGSKKFFNKIKNVNSEADVEHVYNIEIEKFFKVQINHGINSTDGLLETSTEDGKKLKLIIEYKLDEELKTPSVRTKVLIQVLYYLKKFLLAGDILPNVIMVADRNECFVLSSKKLEKYLNEEIDWNIAPSNAGDYNSELIKKIVDDKDISPFIFDIDINFSFKIVGQKILEIANNSVFYLPVNEHNITQSFEYFINNVIIDKKDNNILKISPNVLVSIFIGTLIQDNEYYLHPNKTNELVYPYGTTRRTLEINKKNFDSFFELYKRDYSVKEKEKFKEIADRLVEDVTRRRNGDFYTPTLFADYAHKMIEGTLGEDWKEKYVVWDNCWGTGNLTRDYYFKELYASTLLQSDIDMARQYNQNAKKFQFDFLKDDIPMPNELISENTKLPQGLIDAFKQKKPILFLLNPPFAKNTGKNNRGTTEEVCYTKVREDMNKEKLGDCTANLYAQFLYRIIQIKIQFNLSNVHIAVFSPTLFLTGKSFEKFRIKFLNNFAFEKGVQFDASHFAGNSKDWGISFSIWKSGETIDKNNFAYTNIDINENGKIVERGNKVLYNIDGKNLRASDWVREFTNKLKTHNAPNVTSAINIQLKNTKRKGMLVDNALGFFNCGSNNVDKNNDSVGLYSTAYSNGVGPSIIPVNFIRCVTFFSARKLIEKTWINSKDEYLVPEENHSQYKEFVNNSIIYSLFHDSSQQSSLRKINYKGKEWDIVNEFFWMSKNEIMQLAEKNNFDKCYYDAKTSEDRYVYKILQTITLSAEAQAVLDKANEIVRNTFKYRDIFDSENPNYQIMNWDCGWFQIKELANKFNKKDIEEFNILFKKLEDRMRPMVYELGFLRK